MKDMLSRLSLVPGASALRLRVSSLANMSTAPVPTPHTVLMYTYVEDMLNKRVPYRPDHLAHAAKFKASGQLVMGGAFDDPCDGALIIFKGDDKELAEDFVRNDPYVINGLVPNYSIRKWNAMPVPKETN